MEFEIKYSYNVQKNHWFLYRFKSFYNNSILKFNIFNYKLIYLATESDNHEIINFILPKLRENINESLFRYCHKLKKIVIPSSFQRIEEYAFYDCSSLIQVTIPSSVTYIGSDTFRDCEALSNITIRSNLINSIKCNTFFNCSSLTEIKIPLSVTIIEKGAFGSVLH